MFVIIMNIKQMETIIPKPTEMLKNREFVEQPNRACPAWIKTCWW
jgi:hypothetical protein